MLDEQTGSRFFPVHVVDILLICVVEAEKEPYQEVRAVSNKELAKFLLEFAFELLASEEPLSVNRENVRQAMAKAFADNKLV